MRTITVDGKTYEADDRGRYYEKDDKEVLSTAAFARMVHSVDLDDARELALEVTKEITSTK